tara:strand:- start:15112 stop:15483 length:372 start_codon:yes stop_codon:yes gene_type:complete
MNSQQITLYNEDANKLKELKSWFFELMKEKDIFVPIDEGLCAMEYSINASGKPKEVSPERKAEIAELQAKWTKAEHEFNLKWWSENLLPAIAAEELSQIFEVIPSNFHNSHEFKEDLTKKLSE